MIINDLKNIKNINMKKYRFADVIETIEGHKVLRFANSAVHRLLTKTIRDTINTVNSLPKFKGRANEFGNFVEQKFNKQCELNNLNYSIPKTIQDRKKSSGYPDGVLKKGDKTFYIEIKTFNEKTKLSTLRSFFYSPSLTSKITTDASHILIGFETDNNKRIITHHIVDMYDKYVSLKAEFNTSNKNLY